MAASKEVIELTGTIIETLPGTQFKVELENGHRILAHPRLLRAQLRLCGAADASGVLGLGQAHSPAWVVLAGGGSDIFGCRENRRHRLNRMPLWDAVRRMVRY